MRKIKDEKSLMSQISESRTKLVWILPSMRKIKDEKSLIWDIRGLLSLIIYVHLQN